MIKHPDELDYIKMELQRLDYNEDLLFDKIKMVNCAILVLFVMFLALMVGYGVMLFK